MTIKDKILSSVVLNPREKQDWLNLLPKMSADQVRELDKILSVPAGKLAVFPSLPAKSRPALPPAPKAGKPSGPAAEMAALSVQQLRAAPSIYDFLQKLGQRIRELSASRAATAQQLEAALEQSPLYRSYIQSGVNLLAPGATAELTVAEFEAITDFRAELQKLLTGNQ